MKRFSELTFEEAVSLWNEGFKEYYSDLTMDLNRFLQKVVTEGLSLQNSIVAIQDGRCIGFVLNGFREINGKKYAWNGGTGIAPDYRGQKIGRTLIQASLDIYKQEGVNVAMLEAIKENERAIRLYQNMGYSIFEELVFLHHQGELNHHFPVSEDLSLKEGTVEEIQSLAFYKPVTAWQTQIQSIIGPQVVLCQYENETLGYAVYRKVRQNGAFASMILYQLEVAPDAKEKEEIIHALLHTVFHPNDAACRRLTMNMSKNNTDVYQILIDAGFTTFVEQVHMSVNLPSRSKADNDQVIIVN